MPSVVEFEVELARKLREGAAAGMPYLDINSGEFHRHLGGYPKRNGGDHAMPTCCMVMHREHDRGRAVILSQPPSGKGASLTIRYLLPR